MSINKFSIVILSVMLIAFLVSINIIDFKSNEDRYLYRASSELADCTANLSQADDSVDKSSRELPEFEDYRLTSEEPVNYTLRVIKPEETLEEYLTGLYSELMEEYILHHNTKLYAKHTTEDYLLVVEIGLIEDREEVLTTVDNIDFRSAIIENEEFLHHGDTAVLIGKKEMKGSIMGYTIDATMRYMAVFVQDEDRWKMLSGSFSPVVHPSVLYGEPEGGLN